MSEKKQLSQEELEQISGGSGFSACDSSSLSGKLEPGAPYQRIGENFFLESPENRQGVLYATLDSCYEDNILWWSYTHYCLTVIDANWYAKDNYPAGRKIDVSSARYPLYTNCSGYHF